MCEIPVVEWGDVEKVKVKYFWHDNRDSYSWLFSTIFGVIIEMSPQHRDNNFAVEDRRMGEPRSCWLAYIGLSVINQTFSLIKAENFCFQIPNSTLRRRMFLLKSEKFEISLGFAS